MRFRLALRWSICPSIDAEGPNERSQKEPKDAIDHFVDTLSVVLLEVLKDNLFESLGRVLSAAQPTEKRLLAKPSELPLRIVTGCFFKFC